MFDSRFPNLMRVEGGHLPGLDSSTAREAARMARAIESRTGYKVAYNRDQQSLFVYLGHDRLESGVANFPLSGHDRMTWADLDNMVRYVRYGRMSKRSKDAITAREEARDRHDEAEYRGRRKEEIRRDSEGLLDFTRDKREMGRHWKGSAVVSGLKEE